MEHIMLNGVMCELEIGAYMNNRKSIMIIDAETKKYITNATVNLDKVKVINGFVLIKSYGENTGVFATMYNTKIIDKPIAKHPVGLNWVFECKLL